MRDIVRVNGSPNTVAALLCHGISSPHTVACPLRMSSRSTPYCHRPAASTSCMHLMPVIHCIWPVTYTFNALPAPHVWRGHDEPDVRRLGKAWTWPGAEGHRGTWELRSPPIPRGGSRATRHVAIAEPCRTVVLVPRSRGDARAFLRRGAGLEP
jgi:hypothetical protein